MDIHFLYWIIFMVVVSVMLYIDLYVTDHEDHEKTLKSSAIWSLIWIGVALSFNASLYLFYADGHEKAMEFLAGYLIEKSLSVDNLFVFIMIFQALNIKRINQPHILKWGILSAVVFRIVFIFLGVGLIKRFEVTIYIFGAVLLYAAFKMLKDAFSGEERVIDLEKNSIIRFFSGHFNIAASYTGKKFFTKIEGKRALTPLFIALVMIETADIIFAVDSIPAVLAITQDPFIVITSNIMAILGLRALYFVLSGMLGYFKYLKHGVAFILFFVGIKMMTVHFYKIPVSVSLLVIFSALILSVCVSMYALRLEKKKNGLK